MVLRDVEWLKLRQAGWIREGYFTDIAMCLPAATYSLLP